jgi:maleate isomerase
VRQGVSGCFCLLWNSDQFLFLEEGGITLIANSAFPIGLIVPSSNTVMEADFHRTFSRPPAVVTTRIFLEDVTRETEEKMIREELPSAARLIATAEPTIVVFGCTSAGSLGGIEHDAEIGRSLAQATGAKSLTVVAAMIGALRELRAESVAVLTPYVEDLTHSVAQCISQAGFFVASAAGMGITSNRKIGRVEPDEIARFAISHLRHSDADSVFLSCTNWRAVEALPQLEASVSQRVLSSNQCCLQGVSALLRLAGEGGCLQSAEETLEARVGPLSRCT